MSNAGDVAVAPTGTAIAIDDDNTNTAPPGIADVLPGRGQAVRLMRGGDVVSAHVAWTVGWAVHVVADVDPGPEEPLHLPGVRLIWRGDSQAVCVDGEASPGRNSWTVVCDPGTMTTLEERARRRVKVRTPVDLTVPTRLFPQVGSTWSINLSESGVALEPPSGLLVSPREALVLRMFLEGLPVLTLGRVVAAEPDEPVRVAFERMSPTVRNQLIGAVNRLEAASRVHLR